MPGEDVDDDFAADYAFYGPDGFGAEYNGLEGYFASVRAAFDDLTIRRGITVVEGDYVACQTWIGGTLRPRVHPFPGRTAPPNGSRVTFELMNIFRYDGEGRLAEEWAQIDNRSLLRQLGAEGR
jgi:predicted ester cyclase